MPNTENNLPTLDGDQITPALSELPLTPKVAAVRRGYGGANAGRLLRRAAGWLRAGSSDLRRARL